MVGVFAVGFLSVLGYAIYRRWAPYVWPTGLLSFAILGLVLVGSVEGTYRWQTHTYEQIASELAGRSANVHCQRFSSALFGEFGPAGFVPWDPTGEATQDINLQWSVCHALWTYMVGSKGTPTMDEIVAVHVLTHEARHVSGDTGEATAECSAVQRDWMTAARLGATLEQGSRLGQDYFDNVYPHLRTEYVRSDCAAGAALDEHLPHPPW